MREIAAVANATNRWVRRQLLGQRIVGEVSLAAEEQALAAGFFAGLKDRAPLEEFGFVLAAYAYLLLRGHRDVQPEDATRLITYVATGGDTTRFYARGYAAALLLYSDDAA